MYVTSLLFVPIFSFSSFFCFILFYYIINLWTYRVSVAVRLPPLPLMLKVPHITDSDAYAGLGLGDIVCEMEEACGVEIEGERRVRDE